jgi:hypothetical protein
MYSKASIASILSGSWLDSILISSLSATDGVTLKKVVLDPANSRIILQPFNMDYNVQIIDPDQGLEIYLIGILSLQLRLFKVD